MLALELASAWSAGAGAGADEASKSLSQSSVGDAGGRFLQLLARSRSELRTFAIFPMPARHDFGIADASHTMKLSKDFFALDVSELLRLTGLRSPPLAARPFLLGSRPLS